MATLVCTTGFILLLAGFQAVNSARGQTPASPQQKASPGQSQPQPTAASPSPSQAAIQQPQAIVEARKSTEQPSKSFWDAKLTDWIQVGINVVLLFVVFWQARINRDQRQTMQRQSEIMQGELDITRDSIKQGERALAANEAMAKAAEESAKIAKETFYIGQRPYFGVVEMGLNWRGGKSNEPGVSLTLMNGGETPAWRLKVFATMLIGDTPETGSTVALSQWGEHISQRFVPSKEDAKLTFLAGRVLTDSETEKLFQSHTAQVFVKIDIAYEDMKREGYVDSFTVVWTHQSGTFRDWTK